MKLVIGIIVAVCCIQFSWSQDYERERLHMVKTYLKPFGIDDKATILAMLSVKRHKFVPEHLKDRAYEDTPLPIGHKQTISQPYIVAFMTQALQLKPTDRVLEIGTGSGYQAAVLAKIVEKVYSIEIVKPLGEQAIELLSSLGYENISVRIGDGYLGWPEAAPFNAIIVTAAIDEIPQPLIDQLAEGGKLILPVTIVGTSSVLQLVTKRKGKLIKKSLLPVRFVPFTRDKN